MHWPTKKWQPIFWYRPCNSLDESARENRRQMPQVQVRHAKVLLHEKYYLILYPFFIRYPNQIERVPASRGRGYFIYIMF
jgi:hypothetical protein